MYQSGSCGLPVHRRTYNPEEGRGRKKPITQAEAMAELREVVESMEPDGFTPTIIKQTDSYLYAEYKSPTFGVSSNLMSLSLACRIACWEATYP